MLCKQEDTLLAHYTEELSGIIIIHISGTLTRNHLKEAEDIWNEELNKKPEILALDLKDVPQIDSITINHLFKFSERAVKEDVKLIIYDVSDELKKIFDLIKLDRVITFMTRNKFEEEYRIRR